MKVKMQAHSFFRTRYDADGEEREEELILLAPEGVDLDELYPGVAVDYRPSGGGLDIDHKILGEFMVRLAHPEYGAKTLRIPGAASASEAEEDAESKLFGYATTAVLFTPDRRYAPYESVVTDPRDGSRVRVCGYAAGPAGRVAADLAVCAGREYVPLGSQPK